VEENPGVSRDVGWALLIVAIVLGFMAVGFSLPLLGLGPGGRLTVSGYVLFGFLAAVFWIAAVATYGLGQHRLGGKPLPRPKLLRDKGPRSPKI
jgi:hypothetical protein